MHKTSAIFCLAKPKVFLPPLTHAFPSPTEVCPETPCLKEAKSLQQLLVFLQQKTAKENAHIKELKKYHLQLQQVCNVCVYV